MTRKEMPASEIDRGHFLFWGSLCLIIAGLIWLLNDILAPFITGVLVAYFFNPLVSRLAKSQKLRWFPSGIILVIFFASVAAFIVFLMPFLIKQILLYADSLSDIVQSASHDLPIYFEKFIAFLPEAKRSDILKELSAYLGSFLSYISVFFKSILDSSVAVFDLITFVLITPFVSFYLMRDWPLIKSYAKKMIPRPYLKTIEGLVHDMDMMIASFIRGQIIVILILCVFYAALYSVIGLNFGILIGVMAGFLTILPYIGAIVAFAVASGVALFQFDDWKKIASVLLIYIVGHVLEGSMLTPVLVGKKIGIHPVWIIFALLAGHHLLGLTGVLLAVPIAAIIGVLIRFMVATYRSSRFYT